MEDMMETAGNFILYFGFKVLSALVIFVVGRIIATWLRGVVEKALQKKIWMWPSSISFPHWCTTR